MINKILSLEPSNFINNFSEIRRIIAEEALSVNRLIKDVIDRNINAPWRMYGEFDGRLSQWGEVFTSVYRLNKTPRFTSFELNRLAEEVSAKTFGNIISFLLKEVSK